MKSSASSCSVGAQCVRYSPRDKVIAAGVGTGVGVCVGAMVGVGVGTGVGVCVGAMVGVGVGTGVGVGVEAMVGVGVGTGVGVGVEAMVGVGVGTGVTPGCAVTVGGGTAPADGVGLGAPEHPVRSMARRIAPAHTKPMAMDFDIITLLGARFSAAIASTLAFRMTRRKVFVCTWCEGYYCICPTWCDRTLSPLSSGEHDIGLIEASICRPRRAMR